MLAAAMIFSLQHARCAGDASDSSHCLCMPAFQVQLLPHRSVQCAWAVQQERSHWLPAGFALWAAEPGLGLQGEPVMAQG